MKDMNEKIGYRPTWAEVDLLGLGDNFELLKSTVSARTKILVTVKADAYGHGLIPVARKLSAKGVDYFGVASIDEGIKLRRARIETPILILGLILEKDMEPLFEYHLTPTVCTLELAEALNKTARSFFRPIKVHVKVDTGMGRVGVLYKEAYQLIKKILKMPYVYIEGIFTHLACADVNDSATDGQIDLFNKLNSKLLHDGIHIQLLHAANSIGSLNYEKSHFNMIRPGLVIYGLYPKENLSISLKPVLSLKTKIIYVKKVPAGYGISYGHTYVTRAKTTIATLPIGYGDGYPRNLSNRGPVLIKGNRFTISGQVCMDQIMVDVGDLPVKIGEDVVLIGSQGKDKISTEELACLSGTIPYEIVCGLGSRIPRIYVDGHVS